MKFQIQPTRNDAHRWAIICLLAATAACANEQAIDTGSDASRGESTVAIPVNEVDQVCDTSCPEGFEYRYHTTDCMIHDGLPAFIATFSCTKTSNFGLTDNATNECNVNIGTTDRIGQQCTNGFLVSADGTQHEWPMNTINEAVYLNSAGPQSNASQSATEGAYVGKTGAPHGGCCAAAQGDNLCFAVGADGCTYTRCDADHQWTQGVDDFRDNCQLSE